MNIRKGLALICGMGLLLCTFPANAQNLPGKLVRALHRAPRAGTWGALQGARPSGIEFGTVNQRQISQTIEKNRPFDETWRAALKSSFYAKPPDSFFNNVFSGVVFQSERTGKAYGVITTHDLSTPPVNLMAEMMSQSSLKRNFDLQAFDAQGNEVTVPARVVQLGAFGTIDLALVELAPSALRLFTPARIAKRPVAPGQKLLSQGFSSGYTVFIPDRQILQTTPFSVRTTMPGPDWLRRGLCGSPLFNEQGELVAIHTGSKIGGQGNGEDIGYATKAQFLENLVEAYEGGKDVFIPFEINGMHITDLRVDEYVSRYKLVNEYGRVVWDNAVDAKFPFNHVQKQIERFSPHYMDVIIGRIKWAGENGQYAEFEREVRGLRYDFQTQQVSELDMRPLYQQFPSLLEGYR